MGQKKKTVGTKQAELATNPPFKNTPGFCSPGTQRRKSHSPCQHDASSQSACLWKAWLTTSGSSQKPSAAQKGKQVDQKPHHLSLVIWQS